MGGEPREGLARVPRLPHGWPLRQREDPAPHRGPHRDDGYHRPGSRKGHPALLDRRRRRPGAGGVSLLAGLVPAGMEELLRAVHRRMASVTGVSDMRRAVSLMLGASLALWCSSAWALGGVRFDARSARSGAWSDAGTWEAGRAPRPGDRVQ